MSSNTLISNVGPGFASFLDLPGCELYLSYFGKLVTTDDGNPYQLLYEYLNAYIADTEEIYHYEWNVRKDDEVEWLRYLNFAKSTSLELQTLLISRAIKSCPSSIRIWRRAMQLPHYGGKDRRELWKIFRWFFKQAPLHVELTLELQLLWPKYLFRVEGKITETREAYNSILLSTSPEHHLDTIWPAILQFAEDANCLPLAYLLLTRHAVLAGPKKLLHFLTAHTAHTQSDNQEQEEDASLKEVPPYALDYLISVNHAFTGDEYCEFLNLLLACRPNIVPSYIADGLRRYPSVASHLWLLKIRLGPHSFQSLVTNFENSLSSISQLDVWKAIYHEYKLFLTDTIETVPPGSQHRDTVMTLLKNLTDTEKDRISMLTLRDSMDDPMAWLTRVNDVGNVSRIEDLEQFDEALNVFNEGFAHLEPSSSPEYLAFLLQFATTHELAGEMDEAIRLLESSLCSCVDDVKFQSTIYRAYFEFKLRAGVPILTELDTVLRMPIFSKTISLSCMALDISLKEEGWKKYFLRARSMLTSKILPVSGFEHIASQLLRREEYDDLFNVLEIGISTYARSSINLNLHLTYLTLYISRYGSKNREYVRDLFDKCLTSVSSSSVAPLVFLAARFEFENGLYSRGLSILQQYCPLSNDGSLWISYVSYGITYDRKHASDIMENALKHVTAEYCAKISRFMAYYETFEGSFDRARGIYSLASSVINSAFLADNILKSGMEEAILIKNQGDLLYEKWKEFERDHGDVSAYQTYLKAFKEFQLHTGFLK